MGTLLLPAKSHSPPAKVVFQISCNKEVARVSPAPPRDGDEARRVNVGRRGSGPRGDGPGRDGSHASPALREAEHDATKTEFGEWNRFCFLST